MWGGEDTDEPAERWKASLCTARRDVPLSAHYATATRHRASPLLALRDDRRATPAESGLGQNSPRWRRVALGRA